MPQGPLERASERADRMTVATMPYLERQGTNVVSGAMAGQQFVQNIEESQRRDALAESRMAADESRRRQYDANIGMMHQEMDIRQRQIGIDSLEAESRLRLHDIDEKLGDQAVKRGESEARTRFERVEGGYRVRDPQTGEFKTHALDSPMGQYAAQMELAQQGYGSREQGPRASDIRKELDAIKSELQTFTAKDDPGRHQYLLQRRAALEDYLDQSMGMGGLRQHVETSTAYQEFEQSPTGKAAQSSVGLIRDKAASAGITWDETKWQYWTALVMGSQGKDGAIGAINELLAAVNRGDYELLRGIFQ
jgi:hypothetical protein